jgi:hypothetical protein
MHTYRAFWGSAVICAAEDVGFASLPVCGTAGERVIAEVIANEEFGRASVPIGCCPCYRMDARAIALDLPVKAVLVSASSVLGAARRPILKQKRVRPRYGLMLRWGRRFPARLGSTVVRQRKAKPRIPQMTSTANQNPAN